MLGKRALGAKDIYTSLCAHATTASTFWTYRDGLVPATPVGGIPDGGGEAHLVVIVVLGDLVVSPMVSQIIIRKRGRRGVRHQCYLDV